MIEEIGEIVYSIVIGYIGALELCFVARHIYHLTHQYLYPDDEQTRSKELKDLQNQLKKAVEESELQQMEGFSVMKDGVLYQGGYRVVEAEQQHALNNNHHPIIEQIEILQNDEIQQENILQRSKRQFEQEQIPEKNDENNLEMEEKSKIEALKGICDSSEVHLSKNNSQMGKENDKQVHEIKQEIFEETITKIETKQQNYMEPIQSQVTANKRENETESIEKKYVTSSVAKNNELDLSQLKESNDVEKSEIKSINDESIHKENDLFTKEPIDENSFLYALRSTYEGNKQNEENNSEKVEESSSELISDVSDTIPNRSPSSSVIEDSKKNLSLAHTSDKIEAEIHHKSIAENLGSIEETHQVEQNENKNLEKSFAETSQSNQSHESELVNDKPIKSETFNPIFPELLKSPNEESTDSESSADEEENSIATVVEKKSVSKQKHDNSEFAIVLNEEEKEKVINSTDDEIKFKDISEVLKSSSLIGGDVVEASLHDDFGIDDTIKIESMNDPKEPKNKSSITVDLSKDDMMVVDDNKDETENMRSKEPLGSSARIDAYVPKDEMVDDNEDEIKKQNEIENLRTNKPLRRSPRMDEIDHYEERWQSEEKEHHKDIETTIEFIKAECSNSNPLETVTTGSKNKKLTLDLTKEFINKEQCLTPSIELFDESGQKSPSVNMEDSLSPQPFTPSFDILEGLSDFYDFNASINPSRSRSVSRSTSVQPIETHSEPPSRSLSPAKVIEPTSSYTDIKPKNIEYLSDFYDFNVNLNKKVYPKMLCLKNDVYRDSIDLIAEEFKKMHQNMLTEKSKSEFPCFDHNYKELKSLSEKSVSLSTSTTDSFQIEPDPNFMRSNYIGESTDYSFDFEELREQTRNFIRSRSPSVSFEDDIIPMMAEQKRQIQSNILKELEEKSSYLTANSLLLDRDRRESDSALMNKNEIVFEIQDESDFLESKTDRKFVVDDIEVEPDENHNFRRFSWQQEHSAEKYQGDSMDTSSKNLSELINKSPLESSRLQDETIELKNISANINEAKDLVIKLITEGTQSDKEETIESEKTIEDGSKVTINDLTEEELSKIDLLYVPKKSYKWRENFKIYDNEINSYLEKNKLDDTPNECVPICDAEKKTAVEGGDDWKKNEEKDDIEEELIEKDILENENEGENSDSAEDDEVGVGETDVDEIELEDFDVNEENIEEQSENNDNDLNENDVDDSKFVEEDNKINHELTANNDTKEEEKNEEKKINEYEKDQIESEIVAEDNVSDASDMDDSESNEKDDEIENVENKNEAQNNECDEENIDELKLSDENNKEENEESENESQDSQSDESDIGDSEFDISFKEESENDTKLEKFEVTQHKDQVAGALKLIDNENDEAANENESNVEDNDAGTTIDNDDGIDEEIYDYNERPDESYNQSEYGENNTYDIEGYVDNRSNEDDLMQTNKSDEKISSANESDTSPQNEVNPNLVLSKTNDDSKTKTEVDNSQAADNKNNGETENFEKQFEKMYDESIKNCRESRIQKDYDGLFEKCDINANDVSSTKTTNDMIEQIYFTDISPSRYERLGSEESFYSNFSSVSQGSLATKSKYQSISHARQIKSDRLRTRYGIAPAIGKFANFENADDMTVSNTPRKEYNWRKGFNNWRSNIKNVEHVETKNIEENSIENKLEEINKNADLTIKKEDDSLSRDPIESQKVEQIINEKIDNIYDEVLKNRRKSRIDKEFQEIIKEIDVKPEELNELDSVKTEQILSEILNSEIDTNKNNISEERKSDEQDKIGKKLKIKKKIRKNSIVTEKAENIVENMNENDLKQPNEMTEISDGKTRKKKSLRKSSIISNEEDGPIKMKKIKKIKKRKSIDESTTSTRKNSSINSESIIDSTISSVTNANDNSDPTVYSVTSSVTTINYISDFVADSLTYAKTETALSTPIKSRTESPTDDAEKYSNSSVSNSTLSLKADDIREQNDLMPLTGQVKLDRIGENEILELIRDSSILGSSF